MSGSQTVIDTTVQALGYELVDVERAAGGLLRVTIDHPPIEGGVRSITLDDCERVTRQLQYALEVDGVDYGRLEVSSPGLDRPLRSAEHFLRFAGEPAMVTLKLPFQGRKRYLGRIAHIVTAGQPTLSPAEADGVALLLDESLQATAPAAHTPGQRRAAAARTKTSSRVKASAPVAPLMTVRFDEMREARLIPMVDFKGRSGARQVGPTTDSDREGDRED